MGKGGGCITSSASDSIFSVMTAAQHKALKTLGCDLTVCYTSTKVHSFIQEAANLSMVNIRILEPLIIDEFQLTGQILEDAITKDLNEGNVPFMVIATIGSTGGACFDDLQSIGPVAQKCDMWMHVDGAYGGNAFILPEMSHLKNGLEYADSLEINPYKMLQGVIELSYLWVKNVEEYKQPWIINATYLFSESDDETDRLLKLNEIDYRRSS